MFTALWIKMAPKGRYTQSCLAAAAAQAANDARARLPNAALLETLRCEYVHAPEEADVRADGSLRGSAQLTFRWFLKTRGPRGARRGYGPN